MAGPPFPNYMVKRTETSALASTPTCGASVAMVARIAVWLDRDIPHFKI